MEELPTELNIITLNCWGLLHLSQHRAERLTAIGRQLAGAEPTPHIVALQEVWTQEDYRSIRRETRFALPFGKYYHSGALFGGGLVILSRWPIEESTLFRYPLNGRPTAFFRGDWFVGKGVACARIRYGSAEKDVLEVFNTHTHAIYEHEPAKKDSYLVHRLAQSWEIAKLVRGAAERGHLAVALGDFNDVPLSLSYRMMTAHAPIRDAWRVLNPDSSLGNANTDLERARRRPIPSAAFNVAENGVTSNSVYNTWAWPKPEQRALRSGKRSMLVPPDTPDPRGKRIDYIFFSPQVTMTSAPPAPPNRHSGQGPSEAVVGAGSSRNTTEFHTKGWVVKDIRVGMLSRHPDLGCSLSDHFSVEATLLLHTCTSANPTLSSRPSSLSSLNRHSKTHLDPSGAANGGNARPSDDHAASLLALEGTYLESPTASEFRVGSHDIRASYDAQLRAFLYGSPSSYLTRRHSHHSHRSYAPVRRHRGEGLPCGTYDEVLSLIHAYVARERRQRRLRACHFAAWTFVFVACCAGVWFARPSGVAFLLLILSALGFAAGTVDGLVALLFFGGEIRALKEFEWEIMNAKATASGSHGIAQQHQQQQHPDDITEGTADHEKNW
ncbi:phospholipase C type enzyme [Parahypoxylon ruwenzoriense]